LQILVASDCSDDGTDDIVREFGERGVELVALPERRGKVAAQNTALERATGEVLVFSDSRILLSRDSIAAMMEDFADPEVGCVSSTDEVIGDGAGEGGAAGPERSAGEGLYVRYEMWLRRLEAETGTLIGASGSFYAVRRALAMAWSEGLTRGFLTPLKVIEAGYRAIPEPRAIGRYRALAEPEAEFRRKVRTVMRGMAVLFSMRQLLNPFKHRGVALRLWSHKVLRWTVPFFLVLALLSSLLLAPGSRFYSLALAAQVAFYVCALLGYVNRRLESQVIFRVPLFFANVNLSILLAWIRYLRGARQVTWEPTRR
jgi:cellulose synthase/poly-beta-1,6-N-acetylglucosamine synthase-like glycosyltransferase